MKVRCVKDCFYKNTLVKEGEVKDYAVSKPPAHFEEVKEKKAAKDKKKQQNELLS